MTYEQFFAATRLFHLNTTRQRRRNFWCVWYGYPVLGTVFALLTILIWVGDQKFSGTVAFTLVATIFFFGCRLSFPSRVRKLYEQQKDNLQGVITITSAGVRYERKNGTANAEFAWSGFESWLERDEMFLLIADSLSFVRIPKDKMTKLEQDEVRDWLPAISKPVA